MCCDFATDAPTPGGGDDVTDGLLIMSELPVGPEADEMSLLAHAQRQPQCSYILIEALDLLLLNVTPSALDVVTEITEVLVCCRQ